MAAVKEQFPGASVTRCVRGEVDVDLVLGVNGFSLDKALGVSNNYMKVYTTCIAGTLWMERAAREKDPCRLVVFDGQVDIDAQDSCSSVDEMPVQLYKVWFRPFIPIALNDV